jgi:cyclopropane fatty-acyl-phospholipid synthase-like methyltransferase
MKVKDLIKFLSEQDQNLEVVIKHIDNTDWCYELPLREEDVYVSEVYEVDEANFEEGQVIESGDECLVIELSFE